ncbi:FRG domain-containing protein [Mariniphaga anaerophila]|uniref:FRG domain-containing protein n=1 Tax=Mariniphaga anaerophila TaxID=1484053 RepID=A0A1M5GRF5_9BACT|nr:FRG domain-containing protein [Mariniphaga anaerophila]SHG06296.1 FRG domain-containing protein [Mariniphaga anaerophila]
MKYSTKTIKSLSDLISKLKDDSKGYDGPIWFRGQPKMTYKLLPSYYRFKNPVSEKTLIQKFKQNATLLLNDIPSNDFEWLFLMQHHGVPTRLLDWSESPLVAAYFACQNNNDDDSALWVLLPVELNINAGIRPEETFNIPSLDDDALLSYSPPRYQNDTTSKMYPVATITTRNNSRMQSQLGCFTIFHKEKKPIEEIGDKNHLWRYKIPKDSKKEILEELKLCGINRFTLFPELESIGETLKKELK